MGEAEDMEYAHGNNCSPELLSFFRQHHLQGWSWAKKLQDKMEYELLVFVLLENKKSGRPQCLWRLNRSQTSEMDHSPEDLILSPTLLSWEQSDPDTVLRILEIKKPSEYHEDPGEAARDNLDS